MDAQRALLDELMGAARNLTDEEKKGFREIKWDDREVCGPFMVRFCPHDLFVNTKSDLGPCPKIHDPKLKESFENSPRYDSYVPKFEAELALFCEKLVSNLDRKVKRGHVRLAQDEALPPPTPLSAEKTEQLVVIEEKIKKLLEQIESLGEADKVDEAEALMRKVDLLNGEKTVLTQGDRLALLQEKKMALCEICGSFLIANDAAERTQSHVTGKQHVGYNMVRDFISEFHDAKEKVREGESSSRDKETEERKTWRKEYDRRERHGDRERDRYREREYNHGRSYEQSGRDSRESWCSDWKHGHYRNGRDWERSRGRDGDIPRDRIRGRSRSRSPVGRRYRRASRSPLRR